MAVALNHNADTNALDKVSLYMLHITTEPCLVNWKAVKAQNNQIFLAQHYQDGLETQQKVLC